MSTVTTEQTPTGWRATATAGAETFTGQGETQVQALEDLAGKILELTAALVFNGARVGIKPKRPLWSDGQWVLDADGKRVVTCSGMFTESRCELWDAAFIDANPHFMCPKCGRLGIRMEEAMEAGRGLNVRTQLNELKGEK
jgi:hypothetical protein